MDIYSIYILTFFCVFLIMPTVYFLVRFILWLFLDYCGLGSEQYRNRRNRTNQQRRRGNDRQGNIYTISDDNAINAGPPRFADFFYLEPGSEEAARIRAQLEKDDKELPSYDEVMRLASLPQSPLAMEAGTIGVSTTSIATTATVATDISIPAPPYTEVDLNATLTAATAAATSSAIAGTPSTSRAAGVIAANTITTTTSTNA